MLTARGALPVELPTIRFLAPLDLGPLDASIAAIESYDWIIFTSTNGVRAFTERLAEQGRAASVLGIANLVAIGPSTSSALRDLGLSVDVCPSNSVAEAVLEELRRYDLKGARVLLPQAQDARDVLAIGLVQQGALVQRVPTYRTVHTDNGEVARRLFLTNNVDIVTLTSSSTVKNLFEIIGSDALELIGDTTVASIGPITSRTARELGLVVSVEAREHTIDGLVRALESYLGGEADGG